jgi:hypothetical protein
MRFFSSLCLCASVVSPVPAQEGKSPDGVFVAVGHNGVRLFSVDGKTWSKPVLGKEGETYRSVRFQQGICATVGSYGGANIFAVTTDGQAWKTLSRDAKYVNYIRCLGVGKDFFLGIGGDAGGGGIPGKCFVTTSKDGLAWTDMEPIAGKSMLRRVAFGNDRFVAVGDLGRRAVSADGKAWIDAPNSKAIDTLIDVAFGNKVFVGVGLHGLRMTSGDGKTWENRQVGDEGEHLNSVLWTGSQFVAVGQGATYFSKSGTIWQREKNANAPITAVYGNGVFVGARWKGRLVRSPDAVAWHEVHKSEHHLEAVGFGVLKSPGLP